MDKERYRENFKNHVATFMDYGNIKVLDFKAPDTSEYRIRFLFEEDYYRLHISGDLGELTASNNCNMTYEKFSDFVHNADYFAQKVDCHNRPFYYYDENKARAELIKLAKENDWLYGSYRYDWCEDEDERIEMIIDDILIDYLYETGLSDRAIEEYAEFNLYDIADTLGRCKTEILELYLFVFELATEQLKRNK